MRFLNLTENVLTRHEGKATGKLHDASRSCCVLQNRPIGAGYGVAAGNAATARDRRLVVSDGEGSTAADLHSGGGGGDCGLGAGAAWQTGHSKGWLQSVLKGKK